MAAEPEAGCNAQRRPKRLPATKGIVEDQVVKTVGSSTETA